MHIDGKQFEHALNNLVCVGQLINGHRGLNLGVHARGHVSDLDRHKFGGDKGCPMGRSNLAGGRKGGHDCNDEFLLYGASLKSAAHRRLEREVKDLQNRKIVSFRLF